MDTNRPKTTKEQALIDATYNKEDYPIMEKTQNAYLMPEGMQQGVDCIDSFKFYEDMPEFKKIFL